jgi:hypothetical protein
MKWTDEPPTEPGWYWWKNNVLAMGPYIVEVTCTGSYLSVIHPEGVSYGTHFPPHSQWAGPIPEPETGGDDA